MKKLFTLSLLAVLFSALPALAVTWTITYPTNGKASSVDDVQVKCTEVLYRFTADDAAVNICDASNNVVRSLVRDNITLTMARTYCTADFEFTPAITIPGTYHIDVPAGTFLTNDLTPCEAFTITFTVENASFSSVDPSFTCIDPVGGKGSALEYIQLTSSYTWDQIEPSASGSLIDSKFQEVQALSHDNFYWNNGVLMVILNPAVTTPGSYMLIINEGSLVDSSSSVTNNTAMIELTVEEGSSADVPTVTAMPEDGATVSESVGIQAILLSVDGYKAVVTDNTLVATITKNGSPYASVDTSCLSVGMDQATLYVALPEGCQMNSEGSYIVSFPAGFFSIRPKNDSDAAAEDSPAIVLRYTISAPSTALTWTVSPAPGEVDKIDHVSITFSKPVKIAKTKTVGLFWTPNSPFIETITEGKLSLSDDGLTADIDFSPVFTDGGIFQVRLFEGDEQLSVVDGENFPGMDITYKVNAPLYTQCDPEAGSTVTKIDVVKVKFPRNYQIALDNFHASFKQGTKDIEATLEKESLKYDFGDVAYIQLKAAEPITTSGAVELVVDAGSLNIINYGETMPAPQISVWFTVDDLTGVSAVDATEALADVYTAQGVRVMRNANAEAIRTLAPGLYIVSGRKVVVK